MKAGRTQTASAAAFAVLLILQPARAGTTIFVNDDAPAGGNGQTWATAYRYLQDALTTARNSGGTITDIWVAAGTYKPDRDAAHPAGTADRNATFQLVTGVALRGGFVGTEDPATFDLGSRDFTANLTALTGDLLGNDGPNFAGMSENSSHVVTAQNTGAGTLLDGFTIKAGNAATPAGGGGLYQSGGSTTLSNCVFTANCAGSTSYYSTSGGAVAADGVTAISNCAFLTNATLGFNGVGGALAGGTTVSKCLFSGNSSRYASGAIASTGTFTNCVFEGNSTVLGTGGVARGGATFYDCTFSNNAAATGGALDGVPKIVRCRFVNNSATRGGAVSNVQNIHGCIFQANRADYGGALFDSYSYGYGVLTNCTFFDNSASLLGGGLYNSIYSQPAVTNCIFWGNADGSGSIVCGQIAMSPGSSYGGNVFIVKYCCVQGGWSGTGNIGQDQFGHNPLFVNSDDGDLHLQPGSPCIDAGDSAAAQSVGLTTDADGNPRFVDDPNVPDTGSSSTGPVVDMGALERQNDCNTNGIDDQIDIASGTSLDCNSNGYPDECESQEDCNGNGVQDVCDIAENASQDCNLNRILDECEIASGTAADCNGNGVPDGCEDDCNVNGIADACDIGNGTSLDSNGNGVPDECRSPVLYVRSNASGRNSGSSWSDAYVHLSRALKLAAQPGNAATEIWVAEGTYKPDPTGLGDPRWARFRLLDGVGIYGGFAGTETVRGQRNPTGHPSILSGDLAGDDGLNFSNNAENSYHVVVAEGNSSTAVINGFTITAGNANVGLTFADPHQNGAGLLCTNAQPSIAACTFLANSAKTSGGAAYLEKSPARFDACRFLGNVAANGGALYSHSSDALLTNCLFSGNTAETAGGLYNAGTLNLRLVNCTLAGNVAWRDTGGAIYNYSPVPYLTNCVLWGNRDKNGSNQMGAIPGYPPVVSYSCVEGGWSGTANMAANPLFLDADGSDGLAGTLDDDLRIQAGSPCVDAAKNAAVPAGVLTDLDGHLRFFDNPATADCPYAPGTCGTAPILDIGAYEFIPPIPGDFNGDGDVDDGDFTVFSGCQIAPALPIATGCENRNLDGDTDLDLDDFGVFQRCYSGNGNAANRNCAG